MLHQIRSSALALAQIGEIILWDVRAWQIRERIFYNKITNTLTRILEKKTSRRLRVDNIIRHRLNTYY